MEGLVDGGAERSCKGNRRLTIQRHKVRAKLSAAKTASAKFMIVAGDLSTSGQKMSGDGALCQFWIGNEFEI